MRTINADELTDKAEILYQHTPSGKIIPWSAVRVCVINNIKTIEAEPVVHAHWEVRGGVPYCSVCGEMLNGYSYDNDVSTTPRCSFCGAKMYGGLK